MRISFVEHPRSLEQSYGEHLIGATGIGLSLLCAGYACLVHALLPFLFTNTASQAVLLMQHRLVVARRRSVDEVIGGDCDSRGNG